LPDPERRRRRFDKIVLKNQNLESNENLIQSFSMLKDIICKTKLISWRNQRPVKFYAVEEPFFTC
jgi:hypothetical protein